MNDKKYALIKNNLEINKEKGELDWLAHCTKNQMVYIKITQKNKLSKIYLTLDHLNIEYIDVINSHKEEIVTFLKKLLLDYKPKGDPISGVSAHHSPSFEKVRNEVAEEIANKLFNFYMELLKKR